MDAQVKTRCLLCVRACVRAHRCFLIAVDQGLPVHNVCLDKVCVRAGVRTLTFFSSDSHQAVFLIVVLFSMSRTLAADK